MIEEVRTLIMSERTATREHSRILERVCIFMAVLLGISTQIKIQQATYLRLLCDT